MNKIKVKYWKKDDYITINDTEIEHAGKIKDYLAAIFLIEVDNYMFELSDKTGSFDNNDIKYDPYFKILNKSVYQKKVV